MAAKKKKKKRGRASRAGVQTVQRNLPKSRGVRCSVTVTIIPFFFFLIQKKIVNVRQRALTTYQAQGQRGHPSILHSIQIASPSLFSVGFNGTSL
jgi:hypothetical protein